MFICVYVGIIRNIVYYIMIINSGYLFIYIYSISVVGDFWFIIKWCLYLFWLFLLYIFVFLMLCCFGFGIKMWELE